MLKDEVKVALRIPEILIPKGSMYEGKILNVSLVIPKEDMSFKDVLIDATMLIEEITKRVVAEMSTIVLGIPALAGAQEAEAERLRMEEFVKRRRT